MVRLKPIDSNDPNERKKALHFLRTNYPSPVPLSDFEIQDRSVQLFWAYEERSKTAFGITGYKHKTRFLAESVRTTVHKKHRGKGLGVKLSDAIEKFLRKKGYKKIMTTIYTHNIPMIVIKLQQGYKFEGCHPSHEAPGLDEYSLGKLL